MANHISAKKRARQTITKTERNRSIKSGMRKYVTNLRSLAAAGKKDEAIKLLPRVTREIDRAANRGAIKKATASRKISHLNRLLAKIN